MSGRNHTWTVHNSISFASLDSPAHMAKHHPAAKDDQKETSEFLRKKNNRRVEMSLNILMPRLF